MEPTMFDTAFRKGGTGGVSDVSHRPPAPAPGPHALRLAVSGGAPRVQTKLEVGPPDDEFEREADAVADEVMRMPDPALEEEEEQQP